MVVTEEGSKVAVLLYLMQASQLSRSLCFTKSVQSTEKYSLRMSDWESEGVNGFVCV